MIQHIVMMTLAENADAEELASVMEGLAALELPGFVGFEHGPNLDFEKLSQSYPYGFICSFEDSEALQIYADDPRHKALGSRLIALCTDGVFVADLKVG